MRYALLRCFEDWQVDKSRISLRCSRSRFDHIKVSSVRARIGGRVLGDGLGLGIEHMLTLLVVKLQQAMQVCFCFVALRVLVAAKVSAVYLPLSALEEVVNLTDIVASSCSSSPLS